MKARSIAAAAMVALSSIAFSGTSRAQAATASSGEASAALTHGEIRKVDKEAGKLTIRHEALTNLEMPAMTMVFHVADPKLLDSLKQGDKVDFRAERVDGKFTVTKLEPARPL